jgi:hypothetical protein
MDYDTEIDRRLAALDHETEDEMGVEAGDEDEKECSENSTPEEMRNRFRHFTSYNKSEAVAHTDSDDESAEGGLEFADETEDEDEGSDNNCELTPDYMRNRLKHFTSCSSGEEGSSNEEDDEIKRSSPVSPPLCTEEYTFLPGCVEQRRSCVKCPVTHRKSNVDLAARAVQLNMSSVSNGL